MRPGKRYCLWSLGIAEVLVLGLVALSVLSDWGSGSPSDFDPWVVGFALYYWTLICLAGACIAWAVWAARLGVRRAQRLSFCRG